MKKFFPLVDGGFTDWKVSGECSVTCGDQGTVLQTRTCTNPSPKHGGAECIGETKQNVPCYVSTPCPGKFV